MPTRIESCRICGNSRLVKVLDLGEQTLTGVFPSDKDQRVTRGPLQLVKCHGESGEDVCGLLQLAHSYELDEMYGDNYGYRSGLNPSMVKHLREKVARILARTRLEPTDLIVDIGSNDSTTLQAYPAGQYRLVGIDPTGTKFRQYYPPHIELIPDFFSLATFRQRFGNQKAKVVTSFSMFYDLEDPLGFMGAIREILADDGIWVFEQSYMPTMLERNSYDTVCHEHLEYYGLRQIRWMTERAGFHIIDVEFNDVNGGSFSVTAAPCDSGYEVFPELDMLLAREDHLKLSSVEPYAAFASRVEQSRDELLNFLQKAKNEGKRVAGVGASTKGNVLLQYCGITSELVDCIGEVNSEKFGRLTPGTLIPIAAEAEVLRDNPDYLLVLPWHFRSFLEQQPKFAGRRLVFPLPGLEISTPHSL